MALGFVGLGTMGSRMARRLLAAGHPVVGWNRTRARMDPLLRAGMTAVESPRAVAEASDVVFTMLADTAALEAVARGDAGLLAGFRRGAVWVEMSTVSPAVTRALGGDAARRGATMLDAPVSGGPSTVDQGQLAIFVGGDSAVFERVRPILTAIGPSVTHVGAAGMGISLKVAINLGAAVQMLAFSESVLLAEKSGMTREAAVRAVLGSVMGSPMLKYRAPFVLDMPAEPFFNVAMMQKDVQLALELGRQLSVPLPTTAVTNEVLSAARGLGLTAHDFAVVFDVLATLSGAPPTKKPTGGL